MDSKKRIDRKIQLRNGSYSSVLILMAIIIFLFINFAVWKLPSHVTNKSTGGVDFYSLEKETKDYLKGVDAKLTLNLLSDAGGNYEEYPETICGVFAEQNKKIEFKKIDTGSNPSFKNKYANVNTAAGSVVVINEDTGLYKLVDFDSLCYVEQDSTGASDYITVYDGEGQLLSAISYVTGEVNVKLYETTGHGEFPLSTSSAMTDALDKSNYILSETALSLTDYSDVSELPADMDVMVIASPIYDFTAEEAKLVKDYIASGGKLIITYNIYGEIFSTGGLQDHTNFADILAYAGLKTEGGIVSENDKSHYYSVSSEFARYFIMPEINAGNNLTAGLEDTFIIVPLASRVSTVDTDACETSVLPLLSTSNDYKVEFYEYDENGYLSPTEVNYTNQGTIALYEQAAFENGNTAELLVIGASYFLDDVTGNASVIARNVRLVTNAISVMTGNDNTVYAQPKSQTIKLNVIDSKSTNLYTVIYLVLIPLGVLFIGFIVWLIRRAK